MLHLIEKQLDKWRQACNPCSLGNEMEILQARTKISAVLNIEYK